jgi:hypothetical protein
MFFQWLSCLFDILDRMPDLGVLSQVLRRRENYCLSLRKVGYEVMSSQQHEATVWPFAYVQLIQWWLVPVVFCNTLAEVLSAIYISYTNIGHRTTTFVSVRVSQPPIAS